METVSLGKAVEAALEQIEAWDWSDPKRYAEAMESWTAMELARRNLERTFAVDESERHLQTESCSLTCRRLGRW